MSSLKERKTMDGKIIEDEEKSPQFNFAPRQGNRQALGEGKGLEVLAACGVLLAAQTFEVACHQGLSSPAKIPRSTELPILVLPAEKASYTI